MVVLLLLSGCASKNSDGKGMWGHDASQGEWILGEGDGPEATAAPLEEEPQALADSLYLTLMQNQLPGNPAFLRKLPEMLSLTVTESSRNGEMITASVKITAPDMYAVAADRENTVFSGTQEADTAVCAAMETAPERTMDVTVVFRKGEDRWIPEMSDALIDACYGGLLTYQQEHQGVE
jgi:hypothetical protein